MLCLCFRWNISEIILRSAAGICSADVLLHSVVAFALHFYINLQLLCIVLFCLGFVSISQCRVFISQSWLAGRVQLVHDCCSEWSSKCLSDVVLSFPFLQFCFHVKREKEREMRTQSSASVSQLKGPIWLHLLRSYAIHKNWNKEVEWGALTFNGLPQFIFLRSFDGHIPPCTGRLQKRERPKHRFPQQQCLLFLIKTIIKCTVAIIKQHYR